MRYAIPLLAILALAPAALADPSPQLVRTVEMRLPYYGIHVDVSRYDTSTVAQLYATLNRREGYFATRRALRVIVARAEGK